MKTKSKGKIVKIARKRKIINFKGATVGPTAHFSEETMDARRQWNSY